MMETMRQMICWSVMDIVVIANIELFEVLNEILLFIFVVS